MTPWLKAGSLFETGSPNSRGEFHKSTTEHLPFAARTGVFLDRAHRRRPRRLGEPAVLNRAEGTAAGWKASLDLTFFPSGERTGFSCRHFGPLRVQKPFYPEGGTCHVYLLHPPGGIVGGDELAIRAEARAGASALATTPAAGKFYRSAGPLATQDQLLRVASGGALEWLPQESIVYPGARGVSRTRVELEAGAAFLGWEIVSFGLPASGGPRRVHAALRDRPGRRAGSAGTRPLRGRLDAHVRGLRPWRAHGHGHALRHSRRRFALGLSAREPLPRRRGRFLHDLRGRHRRLPLFRNGRLELQGAAGQDLGGAAPPCPGQARLPAANLEDVNKEREQ